jgi:hypothetical protein
MSCPSHPPWLDHFDYTWRRVQIMKILTEKCSTVSSYLISLGSKYSPQHPVPKHSQSDSPLYQRPSLTPIQNCRENYMLVCFDFYVIRQQAGKKQIRDWKVVNSNRVRSRLNFRMNQFWSVSVILRYLNSVTVSKALLATFMLWLYPVVWWRDNILARIKDRCDE